MWGLPAYGGVMFEKGLYWFGYVFAHLLFFRANTPRTVVRRLRIAYRFVGVRIVETPVVDGARRTVFLCPYRNLAASRFGKKWLCHERLDVVDDGYVTYLKRHKDIDYHRPHGYEELGACRNPEYCYSEVSAPSADSV